MFKKVFILAYLFFLTVSCSQTEADKVAAAQACLDKSTMATAESCISYVQDVSTQAAQLVKCGAMFASQGFSDPTTAAAAMTNLGSGGNPTSVMSVFAFTKKSTSEENYNASVSAFNYCYASGSPGLLLLATSAQIATMANYVNSTASCGATNMTQALTCLKNNGSAAQDQIVGTAIIAAYALNCTGGTQTSQSMCTTFELAMSGSGNNPATVANNFLGAY